MKKIAFMFTLISGFVFAPVASAEGNVDAGQAKSATCAACHGADGNAQMSIYPKIAGQHATYLAKQLREFKLAASTGGKEGRNNAVMNGMAMGLSDQDIADLSAYYAAQNMSPATAPESVIAEASKLYLAGDAERKITSCIACHGPRGNGTDLSGFPKISSQHPDYIKAQLNAFRSGERNNDMNGMMRDIAKKLTDHDIDILAKYLAGLH